MNQSDESIAGQTRRDFIKGGSVATMMTMLGGVPLFAQAPADKPEEKKPAPGPIVNIGVIGLGPWGREILDQLGALPQAKVVAICDNYPAMVKRGTAKAPSGVATTEDYKQLIANKDVQAVVVATPTHLHKDIALAALAAGKHVYCEAPIAHTIEDARAIALAAKNSVGQIFQAGYQMRCDPQRHWLLPFIRSGSLGKAIMGRSQWHRKTSWRQESSSEERTKAINWRLDKSLSLGLVGEVGIHQIDQAGWLFANAMPTAVSGFGSLVFQNKDGRDVPDTVNLIVEYPQGVRLTYDIMLGNSFDTDFEVYYGSDAAVMIRDTPTQAWMFKEVDSPQFGWEVYARRDNFYKSTGIALVAGGSKQTALTGGAAASAFPKSPLFYALQAFLYNCGMYNAALADYADSGFDVTDKAALKQHFASLQRAAIPTDVSPTNRAEISVQDNLPKYDVGYATTVLAIKAHEAIMKGTRIELTKQMFELA